MTSLAALMPYFKPYRKRLAWGVVCIFCMAWTGLFAPQIVGAAIDALGQGVDRRELLLYGFLMVGVTLFQGIFLFAHRIVLVTLSRQIEFDLRNDFFRHLESLDHKYFQQTPTGDLMARATNDFQAVRMICGPAIMYGANTLFTATGALFFMIRIHLELTLVALVTLPLAAVVTQVFGKRIHALFSKTQESFSDLSSRVQENLAGARIVRACTREAAEEEHFARINDENVAWNRRLIRWTAAFHPLLQSLIGIGFAAVLGYGSILLTAEIISLGELVTFNLFLGKLVWPIIATGWVINLVERGSASFARIHEILKSEPRIRDSVEVVRRRSIEGRLSWRGMSFAYEEGHPILHDLHLEVEPGRQIGIIGRTGAGKSTMLSLIPRLLDPPPGALFVDGIDIRRMPLRQLRRAIAMVPQESFLFSTSVRENIAYGRASAPLSKVREAASLAGLESDLEDFPEGLETLVGERGITLSGGQRQRVALARALLRNPRILLLDDSLSAVDAETEERILCHLHSLFLGKTVFIVSHRISAVRSADRILVLDQGRIADSGTHEELITRAGLYSDLHHRQTLEGQLSTV